MNTEILDKQVIIIDSDKCPFKSGTNYDYYFDFKTPIKNALFIKLIESTVVVNNLYGGSYTNQDSINININDYKRVAVNNTNVQDNDYITNYFDTISIDTSKYLQEYILYTANPAARPATINYTFKNDYSSDTDINSPSMFVLNPVEPSLKRFNITAYDKTNALLTKTNIQKIVIKLCIYTNRRKLTMD